MADRRRNASVPWRGLLASLLLGAVLGALGLRCLSARASPAAVPAYAAGDAQADGQRSVGFELVLRFRVLLPQGE